MCTTIVIPPFPSSEAPHVLYLHNLPKSLVAPAFGHLLVIQPFFKFLLHNLLLVHNPSRNRVPHQAKPQLAKVRRIFAASKVRRGARHVLLCLHACSGRRAADLPLKATPLGTPFPFLLCVPKTFAYQAFPLPKILPLHPSSSSLSGDVDAPVHLRPSRPGPLARSSFPFTSPLRFPAVLEEADRMPSSTTIRFVASVR